MRILFLGDGKWASDTLASLHGAGHEIVGVVERASPSSDAVRTVAGERGLDVFNPDSVNAPEFESRARDLEPRLGVSIAYNQILRKPLLDVPQEGFINLHAGKLPQYRGRNVINWAIINGETEIGLTAHEIDEGIDTGDIINQWTLPVSWTDTYGDVLEALTRAMPEITLETVAMIESGSASRRPQAGEGAYFGGRQPGDEWLDWSDTSENLHNKIRAISSPGPGARTLIGSRLVIIWKAHYDRAWPRYRAIPGQVIGRTPGQGVTVKTGDSTIHILNAEVEGSVLAPPYWPIGTRLGVDALRRAHQDQIARLGQNAGPD